MIVAAVRMRLLNIAVNVRRGATFVAMQTPQRYQELDALRGVAALMVVFFHFTMNRPEYNSILKAGTTGVDLFFMISGFVIFMSLGRISAPSEFVISRTGRLYPTYWACVLFTFCVAVFLALYEGNLDVAARSGQLLGNLTMFQFYLGVRDLDGPYWTMIVEMVFYGVMLLLFSLKLLRHILPLGILFVMLPVVLVSLDQEGYVWLTGEWFPLLHFWPLFFAGILFYHIHVSKISKPWGYVMLLICLLAQGWLFPFGGRSHQFIDQGSYFLMLLIYFFLFFLFINGWIRIMVNKGTLFLGRVSFALYLIHQFISVKVIIPLFYEYLGINFWLVVLGINLPLVIGLAYLITQYIEVPYSRRMKDSLSKLPSLRGRFAVIRRK